MWLMDGFTLRAGKGINVVPDASWAVAGVGDFDGDARSDILWRNASSGKNVMWLMDGFTLKSGKEINPVAGATWAVAGVGAFNGDGKSDLFWRNATTGQNVLWLMDGFNLQAGKEINPVPDANWTPVAPQPASTRSTNRLAALDFGLPLETQELNSETAVELVQIAPRDEAKSLNLEVSSVNGATVVSDLTMRAEQVSGENGDAGEFPQDDDVAVNPSGIGVADGGFATSQAAGLAADPSTTTPGSIGIRPRQSLDAEHEMQDSSVIGLAGISAPLIPGEELLRQQGVVRTRRSTQPSRFQ